MRRFRTVFIQLLIVCCCSTMQGQYPSYFSYSIENGAPTNEYYCILQDKQGYLWLGSDAGVFRFNGITFEHFSSPDLSARSATGLLESSSGRIYGYNFNNQLFYIEDNQLHVIKNFNASVNAIATFDSDKIWVSSSKGLFEYDEKKAVFSRVEDEHHFLLNNNGDYICKNVRGYNNRGIIYHHHNYITEIVDSKTRVFEIDDEYIYKNILISFTQNQPWLIDLENGAIFTRKPDGWKPYSNAELEKLLLNKKITHVIEIDHALWIASYAGIIKFDLVNEKAELFYPDISFSGTTKDFQGNYWFTTLHDGLIRVPNFKIKSWKRGNSGISDKQFSLLAFGGGNAYFSSTKGNIVRLDLNDNQVSQIDHKPDSDISMLHVDYIDDGVLFNKTAELYRLKNGNVSFVSRIGPVKSIFRDLRAGYLVCTSTGLYSALNIEDFTAENQKLASGWFREICKIPGEQRILIASNSGIYELDFSSGSYIVKNRILQGIQLLSIVFNSSKNRVYALSFDGRIFEITPSTLKTRVLVRLNKDVQALQLLSERDYIFLASASGITRYCFSDQLFKKVNKFNGLSSNDVRRIFLNDSNCWAATGNGINCVPFSIFDAQIPLPKLILKRTHVKEKNTDYFDRVEMDYNQGLTIYLDGLSYSSESSMNFAYKIKNYNSNWITMPATTGKIDIPKLPSGNQQIEVKLIDHLSRDSENSIILFVDVNPAFFERWWFFAFIVLAVGVILFFLFRLRIIALRKRQQIILKQLKLENELRLTQQNALKAQMNPHFLFNVLNSIKAFIYENDKRNAARYLSDFSSLVRSVLELSAQPQVSLQRELDALKTYIELEAMLIQHDFSYSIEISPRINPTSIEIPALIIQPYVENAFKHGLRHKSGHKELKLTVDYNEEKQTIEICVRDNGVGRSKSHAINQSNPTNHQSFATSAIEKRIRLLNHEQENAVGVEIIDNFDEAGNPAGTTVKISIHV